MSGFHTVKLDIPNVNVFNKIIDLYHNLYAFIPIDIRLIQGITAYIKGCSIDCEFEDLEGRAYTLRLRKGYLVLVSNSTHLFTQRSDIAHELGHIVSNFWGMPKEGKKLSEDEARQEQICDQIGANLVCPEWAIEKVIHQEAHESLGGEELLKLLSREFQFPKEELRAHLLRYYQGLTLDQVLVSKGLLKK